MHELLKMKLDTDVDIVLACRLGMDISAFVGFNEYNQVQLSTAISEVFRCALKGSKEKCIEYFVVENNGISQSLVVQVRGNKADMAMMENSFIKTSEQVNCVAQLVDDFTANTSPEGDTVVILQKHFPDNFFLTHQQCLDIAHQVAQYPSSTLMEEIYRKNKELMQAMDQIQHREEELHQTNKELNQTNQGVITLTAEQVENLQYLSFHDKMTGLYNRAFFEEEMNRLTGGRQYPVSIIVLDVDKLKLINDSLGHKAGDALLINCAKALQKSIRNNDVLARIGGDEFALILPKTGAKEADQVMERIERAIIEGGSTLAKFPLSVSMGCSTAKEPTITLEETFNEADTNMYRDKMSRSSTLQDGMLSTVLTRIFSERVFIR